MKDSDRIAAILRTFRRKTRLPAGLVPIQPSSRPPDPCGLCRRLRLTSPYRRDCAVHLRQAVLESFRWGEPFLSPCPLGLVVLAVPLVSQGRVTSGIVAGFGLFPEMAKDFGEELSGRLRRRIPASVLRSIPRLGRSTILDTGRLLLSLLGGSGLTDTAALEARRAEVLQQKRIAEVMADLRGRKTDLYTLLSEQQEELVRHVQNGDKNGAREILNRILGALYAEYRMDFEMLKIRLMELTLAVSRAAMEWGVPPRECSDLAGTFLLQLNRNQDLFGLSRTIVGIMESYIARLEHLKVSRKRQRVARMKEFLRERFAERVTSADLGAAAGLHPCRAVHLFKEATGLTPGEYVTRLRLAKAKDLLLRSRLSIAEIAQETGFFDQSHFTKTFKRFEHTTPLRFRKMQPPEGL